MSRGGSVRCGSGVLGTLRWRPWLRLLLRLLAILLLIFILLLLLLGILLLL
jgi:hypothetical protein